MATLNSPTLGKHQVSLTGLDNGGGEVEVTSENIADSTTVGRAVLTATDAAAARTAIGAGTSNLALGTTGTTAMAGNTTAEDIPATAVPGGSATTVQGILSQLEARLAALEPQP